MKRIFVLLVMVLMASMAFAEDAPPVVALSGNVAVGLRADLSKDSSTVYAWDDNDGFPIQINTRFDFNLDPNAGLTVNFRTRGTGQSVGTSGRGIPYLNRGLVWMKALDGMVKLRSGYLWDIDYESSYNAWDTASALEWCSSVDFFPTKELELGFVVPTPIFAIKVADALKDITYGVSWTPSFGRVSVMAQVGSVDANRSLNFGVDFTAIKDLTLRFEGDLQQVGIDKVGSNTLYQQVVYDFAPFNASFGISEVMQKASDLTKLNTYSVLTASLFGMKEQACLTYNFDPKGKEKAYTQAELNVRKSVNKKSWIQVGAYVTLSTPEANPVFSPYINLFAGY